MALLFWGMDATVSSEAKEKSAAEDRAIVEARAAPCFSEERVQKITSAKLSEKLKDFQNGDPLFYALLSVFSEAKKDTCYYAEGKDLRQIFMNKTMLDLSDREVRDGRPVYKTRAPVDEINWVSAELDQGNIKVSSRLHRRFVKGILGKKVIAIPKTLDFTIYASIPPRSEGHDKLTDPEEYNIFMVYEHGEEPYVSELFSFLTGLTSHEMHLRKNDKKANRREAYKTLRHLHEKGSLSLTNKPGSVRPF